MFELKIHIRDADGKDKAYASGIGSVSIDETGIFAPEDYICIETNKWPLAIRLSFDEKIPAADIWLTSNRFDFPIPFGEQRDAYPPNAFSTGQFKMTAAIIDEKKWTEYRNLSENPLDVRGETSAFPHCRASVETRDESVFAARNTIDGVLENSSHGAWPYQSWGDNEDPNAEIMIQFGRCVRADKVVLWLRADYPHDNYWETASLVFSDNSCIEIQLKGIAEAQTITFDSKEIEWVKLCKLIRADGPSPFPALTQWAVYGSEI